MIPRLGAAGMASVEAVPAAGCGVAAPGSAGPACAAAEAVWGSCADCPIGVAPPTAAAAAWEGCAAAWELDRGPPAAHGARVSCQGLVQSAWGPESRSPVTCTMESNPQCQIATATEAWGRSGNLCFLFPRQLSGKGKIFGKGKSLEPQQAPYPRVVNSAAINAVQDLLELSQAHTLTNRLPSPL